MEVNTTLTTLALDARRDEASESALTVALKRNQGLAARGPAQREAAALAWLLLHAATRVAAPPNVVVRALVALRPPADR